MKGARLKEIQKCVDRAGARVASITQSKTHVHILLTNGRKVFTALTPSDRRGSLNLTRDIKRAWNETDNT